jgi:hypothetical protein
MDKLTPWHEGADAPNLNASNPATSSPRAAARRADWQRLFRPIVLCALTLAVTPEMASAGQAKQPAAKMAVLADAAGSRAWWKKCIVMRDDRARLACFDASVPDDADAPDMRPRLSANTAAPSFSASAPPAVTPAPSLSETPVESRAITYRVAVGYGLGIGGHAGSFDVEHGILHSQAGFGSEGDTLSLQGWADNWIADDWSVGFEYLYLNNFSKLDLDLPKGASILTDPITADARADLHGHLGFANIAYRPEEGSSLRPYIGMGLGVGWGSASTDINAQNAFAGSYHYESRAASMFGALQGFLGVDVPLYGNWYASPFGKAVWIPGHPLRVDHRYLDFVFGGAIGRRF